MEIAKTSKGPSGTAGHACAETQLITRKQADRRQRRQVSFDYPIHRGRVDLGLHRVRAARDLTILYSKMPGFVAVAKLLILTHGHPAMKGYTLGAQSLWGSAFPC